MYFQHPDLRACIKWKLRGLWGWFLITITGVEDRKRLGDNNTLQVYNLVNPKLFANSSANPRTESPARLVLTCRHALNEATSRVSEPPSERPQLQTSLGEVKMHLTAAAGTLVLRENVITRVGVSLAPGINTPQHPQAPWAP